MRHLRIESSARALTPTASEPVRFPLVNYRMIYDGVESTITSIRRA
jgi:hypothetical protein